MATLTAAQSATIERIEMAKSLIDSRNHFKSQYKKMTDWDMSDESLNNLRGLIAAYEEFINRIALEFGANLENSTSDNIDFLQNLIQSNNA